MTKPRKIKIKKIDDNRGSFLKILSNQQKKIIFNNKVTEINVSINKKSGTIRGMHYQSKFKEKKLVYCLKGKIIDYCVNVKNNKVYKFYLKENDNNVLLVPEDYAHGFQTLEDDTILVYIHNNLYYKEYEKIINPFNPMLKINWPIKNFTISNKDINS
jgi:dTDP-4-dehydrorhamnose 3,5-epimerase